MKTGARQPNHLLRHERELRGWSLEQAAEELHQLSALGASKRGIINGKMISRWELGQHRPNRFWQKQLSQLYGKSREALGFIEPLPPPERIPARTTPDSQPGTVSLPTPHEAISLLLEASERRPEELLGAWLALRATEPLGGNSFTRLETPRSWSSGKHSLRSSNKLMPSFTPR